MELGLCDLHSFLDNADYDVDAETICRVWKGLVQAVAEVHAHSVIHFDLKPQNFLLCLTNESKVVDGKEVVDGKVSFYQHTFRYCSFAIATAAFVPHTIAVPHSYYTAN